MSYHKINVYKENIETVINGIEYCSNSMKWWKCDLNRKKKKNQNAFICKTILELCHCVKRICFLL